MKGFIIVNKSDTEKIKKIEEYIEKATVYGKN